MRNLLVWSLFVLLTGAMLLVQGCDDATGPPDPVFLVCDDRAELISVDTTVAGGTDHTIPFGNHSLTVPAAAIPEGERVGFALLQVPHSQVRAVVEAESNQPFAADLTLTLSYQGRANCTVGGTPVSNATGLGLYRIEGDEFLPAAAAQDEAVAGRTRSFSTYAIAS